MDDEGYSIRPGEQGGNILFHECRLDYVSSHLLYNRAWSCVLSVLCSSGSMFQEPCIPQVICFHGSMFPVSCFPRVFIFSGSYISRHPSSQFPIFPGTSFLSALSLRSYLPTTGYYIPSVSRLHGLGPYPHGPLQLPRGLCSRNPIFPMSCISRALHS